MDVTRDNFPTALRLFQRLLPDAAFVAIDFEFTGLGPTRPSNVDTPEQRYDAARRDARNYPPIQFGITIFHKRPSSAHCFAIPFNFNIFPHPIYYPASQRYPLIETNIHFQGSTIHFLSANGLDFDRLMKETISWMRPVDEAFLRQVVTQDITARRNPKHPTKTNGSTKRYNDIIVHLRNEISSWISENPHTPACDLSAKISNFSFPHHPMARRLAFDMIRNSYPRVSAGIVGSDNGPRLRVALHPNEQLAKQQREDDIKFEIDYIVNSEVGIRAVVDLLRAQRIPIVVHNGLLDLTKLYANFVGDLPPLLSDFKQQFQQAFPLVYDTRLFLHHMCTLFPDIAELVPRYSPVPYDLTDFVTLIRQTARKRDIHHLRSIDTFVATDQLRLHDPAASNVFADDAGYFFVPESEEDWNYDTDEYGFGRYCSPEENDFSHEAGFDSLETGKMFALMEGLLQSEESLAEVANRIHLGGCGGYRSIDLHNPDGDTNEWFDRNVVIVKGANTEHEREPGQEHWCRRVIRQLTDGTIFDAETSDFAVVSRTGFVALLNRQKEDDISLALREIEKVVSNGHAINAEVKRYELQALLSMEASGETGTLKRRRMM